ncbi:type I glyceraldehyde-3-phosphate dehydrogenase [Algoriphagus halophytocola]|uniref:Glyceraldehyde-3-phosphate dehydrogenase n=1 Tax=Algoriphagus halophytocola TaxID=2991499 RepID=A0ABY6MLB0_9BACT|nr:MULTISPECIES: type I glyceraldehyde-3-phosphate dehydrogenase [unclassified Algoriphagus]UZD23167.1 type I glyceraldehyde-3-phosphate dehydrogenase [Algoriphagus sp. TR-M5]WBL44459.1 type I glyceraldehyde-3-phosphate dehydrogenase [Algoriphagus sp. TR-M9]
MTNTNMTPQKNIRIAINGFGRIGRYTAKLLLEKEGVNLVAINDLADQEAIAHLLKYDSIHRKSSFKVSLTDNFLQVNQHKIGLYGISDPSELPWKALDIDVVIECTGRFTERKNAEKHIQAGAKKVIISAPSHDPSVKMIVLGVNEQLLNGTEQIVSNASCTTNCLAPMVKVLHENFHVVKGYASTVHSYTNDQNLHDAPHRDLRRARAAAYSIIPTTTNAGKALDEVLPEIAGKIEASAMRVPVPDGSLTDLIVELEQEASAEEINEAFRKAANEGLKGYLEVEDAPIVSMDIIGNPHSCIIDAALTSSKGKMIKLVGWYDNEAGYANRLVDLVKYISKGNG